MATQVPTALRDAFAAFHAELELVVSAFATASVAPSCDAPHMHNREWCVVYLNDAWQRFCRELIIASAVYEPRTLSGSVIGRAAGLTSEQDALTLLRTKLGQRRPSYWEPRWHDAVEALRAAAILGIRNAPQVTAALGSTPSPADDINTVRNFVVHRKPDTAIQLRALLTKSGMTPGGGLSSRAVVDAYLSQPVDASVRFLDWCQQFRQIALASVA